MKNKSVATLLQKPNTKLSRLIQTFQKFKKIIIGFLLMTVVIALGYWGWFTYQNQHEEKAFQALSLLKENQEYEKFVKNYSGTVASQIAFINLAEEEWKQGHFLQAREMYEKILKSSTRGAFSSLLENRIGECLLWEGKIAEAEAVFNRLAKDEKSSFLSTVVQINLGRCLFSKGNIQAGLEYFMKLKTEKADTSWKAPLEAIVGSHDNIVQK